MSFKVVTVVVVVVYYYIRWRLKLEGETENMGVCTKERKGVTAEDLMATPCTNSLRWVLQCVYYNGDVYY